MEWKQLLCSERKRSYPVEKKPEDDRTEFRKDYHRIICSASFRRLQDKTQVFPLDQNDFVRTRLTHSLEVSSFAKSLGQMTFRTLIEKGMDPQIDETVRENVSSILECAGLLHDIGNPPFGHFGEYSIRDWFQVHLPELRMNGKPLTELLNEQMQNDLYHFEGNAQALRLVSKLHYLIDENGMHLTFALLNTLIKYPVASTQTDPDAENVCLHKMGYYLAEQELFEEITQGTGAVGCRYPLTYLLEAADDIAYLTADIEDACKKGILSYDLLLKKLKTEKKDSYTKNLTDILVKKYQLARKGKMSDPKMNAVQNWVIRVQYDLLNAASNAFVAHYEEIMNGTFQSELLKVSEAGQMIRTLKKLSVDYIYDSRDILALEISAGNIISSLLDQFVPAAIDYRKGRELPAVQDRLMRIISDNYCRVYELYAKGQSESYCLYLRLLLVTDYICGMTDSFARSMYRRFHGIE